MYAQALRTLPRLQCIKIKQSSAYAQCAEGGAFPDVPLDCIKYLKLVDELGYDVELTYKKKAAD